MELWKHKIPDYNNYYYDYVILPMQFKTFNKQTWERGGGDSDTVLIVWCDGNASSEKERKQRLLLIV